MTGTSSSRDRPFVNLSFNKNHEWIRRRKLRIEQVRNQSKAIAKALRQRVENEEKLQAAESKELEKAKFKCWRIEKLDEMERKLRCALEEFGMGHKLAELEPCFQNFIDTKNKVNLRKAEERGEYAKQGTRKAKRQEKINNLLPLHRRKITRKIEDLRSAFICSVSFLKQSCLESGTFKTSDLKSISEAVLKKKIGNDNKHDSKAISKKVIARENKSLKILQKETVFEQPNNQGFSGSKKECPDNTPTYSSSKEHDTIWINLNDIHNHTAANSDVKSRSSKMTLYEENVKPSNCVEFYDYNSRYKRKLFKEYTNLVEKVDSCSEKVISELIKDEEKIKVLEDEKKEKAMSACQERGTEALRREKISRDYNDMIAKLDNLHKKEKFIKAQKQIPSVLVYMNDERLSEKTKIKQRIMNSKFESIYYSAASEMLFSSQPRAAFECIFNKNSNDFLSCGDVKLNTPAMLKFSPTNLKFNSPVNSNETPYSVENVFTKTVAPVKKKQARLQKKLLLDIDKALKEGRKLRKSITENLEKSWGLNSDLETGKSESIVHELENVLTPEVLPTTDTDKNIIKSFHNQEIQTEDLTGENGIVDSKPECKGTFADFGVQVGDDSWVPSASTSYKSPPSELNCSRLDQFLNCLENLGETEEHPCLQRNQNFKKKLKAVLNDLLDRNGQPSTNKIFDKTAPTLEFYISKLLNMSRENIANLSVSSDISTPSIDGDNKSFGHCSTCIRSNNESVCSCKSLEEVNISTEVVKPNESKNWKSILGERTKNKAERTDLSKSEVANFPKADWKKMEDQCPNDMHILNGGSLINEKNLKRTTEKSESKYDGVTKKCCERITELANLLKKVRQEKEILLSSTSSTSNNVSDRSSVNNVWPKEKELTTVTENNIKRSNIQSTEKGFSTKSSMGDSQSVGNVEDSVSSVETLPDFMNELLAKKIITSPFKWSEGDFSRELDSIPEHKKALRVEEVFGNFRTKVSQIKPSSILSSDEEHENRFENFRENTVNEALRSLQLNWAKRFLKKNEKCTISSSSSDDGNNFRENSS